MAPEQASNPKGIDHRADLYAVGTILYELLTGHTPYHSETGEVTEILFKIFTTEAPSILEKRPDLSDALAKVVHHALAKKPEERLPTALAFAEALEPFGGVASQKFVRAMRSFVPPRIDDDPHAYTAPMEGFPQPRSTSFVLPDGFDAAPGSIPRPGGIPRVTAPIRRGVEKILQQLRWRRSGVEHSPKKCLRPRIRKMLGLRLARSSLGQAALRYGFQRTGLHRHLDHQMQQVQANRLRSLPAQAPLCMYQEVDPWSRLFQSGQLPTRAAS